MSEDVDAEQLAKDSLAVAQRALQKSNELERELSELRRSHQEAVDDLAALSFRLESSESERDYRDLSLDTKVGMVREHAFRKAVNGRGTATLDYDDVMWEVFDGEPGAKHCYKLLRLAAEGTRGDSPPGFEYRVPRSGNRHLHVDAERAKTGAAFFPENKTPAEGGH